MPFPRTPALILAAAAAAAAMVPATAQDVGSELPRLGRPASAALPMHEERELGAEAMQRLRQEVTLANDPEVNEYIDDLGQRLVAHRGASDYKFNFFVVKADSINAFALPGGHIGIHTGLIRETETESELAGVIAHEIGHVTHRHIARRLAQAQQLNLQTAAAILAAVLVGSQDAQAGTATAMAGIAAPIQQQLSHSRTHEREADRVAVHNLVAAEFDPTGMATFFKRLQKASRYSEKPPEYLSTHPLTESRITKAQSIAQRHEDPEVLESGHHPYIRARLTVAAHEETSRSPVAVMRDRLARAKAEPTQRAAALYGLALALSREESAHEQALALLDLLPPTDGERLHVLLGRGEILSEAGRHDAARAALTEARELYPGSDAAIYRHAQSLLASGKAERARSELARAARGRRRSAWLLRLLAEAAYESGREAEGYIALAQYYYQQGEVDLAIAQLRNAIREAEGNRYQRARASALRERWEREHGGDP